MGQLAELLLTTIASVLGLLLLTYPVWGTIASFYAARIIVRRLRTRLGSEASAACALGALLVVFLPVLVAEPVGDAIPAIFPWWLAMLLRWLGSGFEFYESSFLLAIPFFVFAAWATIRASSRHDALNG